ncbi:MAG: diguanylate cyclase (GGDEF)-like protein/PAS domain S-box-containing protein [Chlamydiales bacterium]|jgi:diguanylate cyclase (GGDEF)-like protein/PAS domain S-box-containing protein
MPRFSSSIIIKLAASFLVAALIPVSIALVMLEEEGASKIVGRTQENLETLAQDKEDLIKAHVNSLQMAASTLARSEVVTRFLTEVDGPMEPGSESFMLGALAEDLVHSTQDTLWGATHHVFLTNTRGEVILSPPHGEYDDAYRAPFTADELARKTLGTHLGHSIAEHDFFDEALTSPTITSFFGFEERDHFHQLILHPVLAPDGTPLGLVVVEVAIDAVTNLLTGGFTLGESGKVTLATILGQRVVHSRDADTGIIDSEGLHDAIRTGEATFGDYLVDREREVFGIYLPSSIHPWIVCIEIDRAEVMREAAAMRTYMFKILGITALVLGIVGTLLGMWFGKPLVRCAAAARRVSEGIIKEPIPISRGLDEIGTLERATESMRSRLSDQIQTLDQRVEEKTIQLTGVLEEVRMSQDRFALAVRGSKDGIWDWDLETGKIYFAPRWKELLGLDEDDIGDSPDLWFGLIADEQRADFKLLLERHIDGRTDQLHTEVKMAHADGEPRWMLCRAAAIRDDAGKAVRLAGSLADITDLKQAQQDLRRMANHDRLTGLPNRELFNDRLQQTIARSKRRSGNDFAVLFFDFDRFKVINDSLGHDVGDALLISIAERFHEELREADTAARFGGDEFVVILDDVVDLQTAEDVCDRLLSAFAAPHSLHGHEVVSTASIGLVLHEGVYDDAASMIRDADTSMYQAKTGGRAQYRVFDKVMHSDAVRRLQLEQDMRNVDMDEEFRLVYQSILNLDTGEIIGFEALVRWAHPEHGLMPPDAFVHIAEETGLIVPLGAWVLRTATRQLKEWQVRSGREDSLFMNVNIARRQLLHPSLVGTLTNLIEKFDLKSGDVKLEITETTVMDERHDMIPAMKELRDLGFPLVMDNFGTGHSSLSCLHRFPIDVLKIDRSFIASLGKSREFTAVIQAIVTLAHHLDLDVVAEGIETPEQLAQLQVLGCMYAQGYLFSRPLNAIDAGRSLDGGLPRVA